MKKSKIPWICAKCGEIHYNIKSNPNPNKTHICQRVKNYDIYFSLLSFVQSFSAYSHIMNLNELCLSDKELFEEMYHEDVTNDR